jgi:hypothetical protein
MPTKLSLILATTYIGALLSYCAIRFFASHGSPEWFNVILIPLVVLTILAAIIGVPLSFIYAYVFIFSARRFVVTKIGIETTSTVLDSQPCYDSEDVCICGVYVYRDRLKREHKVKFRYCIHWPSKEVWNMVMQSCSTGAENPVYYLSWLPFVHEIQWKVDNEKTDEIQNSS